MSLTNTWWKLPLGSALTHSTVLSVIGTMAVVVSEHQAMIAPGAAQRFRTSARALEKSVQRMTKK
jgi:hypothetical protein